MCLERPARGETAMEALWRRTFNLLSKLNILGVMRRSDIYWNTTEAMLKTDHYSRIIFPIIFVIINAIYWCLVLL